MPNPTPLAALPTIESVSLTVPRVLTCGPRVLFADHLPAPLLCPLPDGSGVLLEDWQTPDCAAYRVPASLLDAVRLALDLHRVTA